MQVRGLQGASARGRTSAQEGVQAVGSVAQGVGFAFGIVGLFLSGWMAGRFSAKRIDPRRPSPVWQQLPSGWSRNFGSLTIYAMTQDQQAYWWVSRAGKTIIEGPAGTLAAAKLEAEREARELST